MARLRDRPTVDLIFLTFAAVVGFAVMFTTSAVVVMAFTSPGVDNAKAVAQVASIINTLTGAIVGYAAGTTRKPPEE